MIPKNFYLFYLTFIILTIMICKHGTVAEDGVVSMVLKENHCAVQVMQKIQSCHGKDISIENLIEVFDDLNNDVALSELMEVINEYLGRDKCIGVRLTYDDFFSINFPVIAHLAEDHFVLVVNGFEENEKIVIDGDRRYYFPTKKIFDQYWSGYALVIDNSNLMWDDSVLFQTNNTNLYQDVNTVKVFYPIDNLESISLKFMNVGPKDLEVKEIDRSYECILGIDNQVIERKSITQFFLSRKDSVKYFSKNQYIVISYPSHDGSEQENSKIHIEYQGTDNWENYPEKLIFQPNELGGTDSVNLYIVSPSKNFKLRNHRSEEKFITITLINSPEFFSDGASKKHYYFFKVMYDDGLAQTLFPDIKNKTLL